MYQYKMEIVFGNLDANISLYKDLLSECKDTYNLRSAFARNKKHISKLNVSDKNVINITLNSDAQLRQPLKGLHLFSTLILEKATDEQKDEIVFKKTVLRILSYTENFIANVNV